MDSSFFYMICAAATSFFTLFVTLFFMFYKNFRFRENNETENSSSLSLLPPLPRNWTHNVFPSFHGADVRKNFLSHLLKECKSKGIDPFIDNEIPRGEFIGPELKKAIRESRISIVLLSKRYASSSWCLDELVEIMNCNENLGYTVMPIFYEVDPSDVKKQTGDFGKVFKKTCKGKTNEVIGRWSQALAKVATIAGYHSSNSENDVKLIEKIVTDVSDKLFSSTRSRDFDGFVGIRAHMEKMEQVLNLGPAGLDEVKMIGIWGPPGIGKTTIARCVFNKHSGSFDLSVFMTNVKAMYTAPVCSDDYDSKLNLQQKFLSQITNQKEGSKITHLGAAEERLHDKRVLVVLDNVDRSAQLDAMAKDSRWFGPGSWIIVTTQDKRLLRAHGIEDIYKVNYPPANEALQIFCMNAFGHKSPKDGFYELALEVTELAGKNPLGLRVMGSCLRGLSEVEWTNELPRLRNDLHGDIESTLKFSYNSLGKEDKLLFLYIACFFNGQTIESTEHVLAKTFKNVRQGIQVLAEKSLISTEYSVIDMHGLLVQLGREIVRNISASGQSILEPGQRQFLVDTSDICEVLSDDKAGTSSVIGINLEFRVNGETEEKHYTSGRAFERMTNLQFLRIDGGYKGLYFPQNLNSISKKIRLLEWTHFPMTSLPSNFNPEFLVKVLMERSLLEKLWDGVKPLKNLKEMNLGYCKNLKALPDLSNATNLETLLLRNCSSLVELPSSIGNAINLKTLDLTECSSLVKLPSSIGNAKNIQELNLRACFGLVELPSSIGEATNLDTLYLSYCLNLVKLPSSIGNAANLTNLQLNGCSSLKELPSSIGNATNLETLCLTGCSSLLKLPSSIGNATNLTRLQLNECSSLKELPSSIGNATKLTGMDLQNCSNLVELPSSIGNLHKVKRLLLNGCSKLQVLPININMESLEMLYLNGCSVLKIFPQVSTNIIHLDLSGTAVEEVPLAIRSWPRLKILHMSMSYSENLKESPHAFDSITYLNLTNTEIQEIGPWVKGCSRLYQLILKGMKKLVSLPQLPDSLFLLDAGNCESMERLDCSFRNPGICLDFQNCFKLNQEARDLIIQTSTRIVSVLPGGVVPAYFSDRATGGILTVNLNERPLHKSLRFKACFMLVNETDDAAGGECRITVSYTITEKQNGLIVPRRPRYHHLTPKPALTGHLYTFELETEADVTSDELCFEFSLGRHSKWVVKECGVLQLSFKSLQVDGTSD